MKLCGHCTNRGKNSRCNLYTEISNYAEKCKDFKPKKQTNADRIRSMSDEELAEWLTSITDDAQSDAKSKCDYQWSEWLQSEVEEQ